MENSVFENKATVFEGSEKSIRSELDLFSIPPSDVSTLFSGDYTPFYPVISLKDNFNPVQFLISGDTLGYLHLYDSMMAVKCRIVLQDGNVLQEADIVAPECLFFHAMFSNLELYAGDVLIYDTSNFYPQTAYNRKQLSCNPEEKKGALKNEFYYPNEKPDNFTIEPNTGDGGFTRRFNQVKLSKPFFLLGHLEAPIFNQIRYFPADVPLKINLRRNTPECALTSAITAKAGYNACPFRFDIDEATLYIRRKIISPDIINYHRKLLSSGKTMKYPIYENVVTSYTISKDIISNTADNVRSGKLPKIIVIGFISSAAFNGDLSKSMFNFQHYNLMEISVSSNVQSIEYKRIQFNFKENDFLLGLQTLYKTASDEKLGNGITRDSYALGNCLIAFEIFPIFNDSFSFNKTGQIRVSVKFSEKLPENINVIVFTQYQSILQIDNNKNVILER